MGNRAFFNRQQLFCCSPEGFNQIADPGFGFIQFPVICRLIAPVGKHFPENVIQFIFRRCCGFTVFGAADLIPKDFHIIEIADSEGEIDQTEASLRHSLAAQGSIIDTAGIVKSRCPVSGPCVDAPLMISPESART